METWAKASPTDREALFLQTASVRNMSPSVVEKDFWVCWALYHVFQLNDLPHLVFKGGTSLSKVFGIIRRFSEDIDLVINRQELGFVGDEDPVNQTGTNQRKKTVERLKKMCSKLISNEFRQKLDARFRSAIGPDGWSLELDETAPDQDILEFRYPEGIPASSPMATEIQPLVRIELGCRGDQWPVEEGRLVPYAAETYPEQFKTKETSLTVLSAERTFWEKVTLLHRAYFRFEAGKPVAERLFRHYDDVAVMSKHERGKSALSDLLLLEQVSNHKQIFFREAGARYELARKGTLRIAPSQQLLLELKKDYERTREMYFGKEPDFEEVMSEILQLEKIING